MRQQVGGQGEAVGRRRPVAALGGQRGAPQPRFGCRVEGALAELLRRALPIAEHEMHGTAHQHHRGIGGKRRIVAPDCLQHAFGFGGVEAGEIEPGERQARLGAGGRGRGGDRALEPAALGEKAFILAAAPAREIEHQAGAGGLARQAAIALRREQQPAGPAHFHPVRAAAQAQIVGDRHDGDALGAGEHVEIDELLLDADAAAKLAHRHDHQRVADLGIA